MRERRKSEKTLKPSFDGKWIGCGNMMIDYSIVKKTAERIFEKNMDKYGFSFSPLGLYKAAFDEKGKLYSNWRTRITVHKPSAYEYPDLYNTSYASSRERHAKKSIGMLDDAMESITVANPCAGTLKKPVSLGIEEDVIDCFRKIADDAGVSYQTMMNLYLEQVRNEDVMSRLFQEAKLITRRKKAA